MTRGFRGVSAVEIVISIVILAFAVLPIMNMMNSGRKSATLTEHHVLAQLRARRILEVFTSYPYEALRNVPDAEGGGLQIPLPADEDGFPPEYRKNLDRYDELCFFEEIKPGLGVMTVKIGWTIVGGNKREYVLQKILADEGGSLTDDYPLRQQGARFIK